LQAASLEGNLTTGFPTSTADFELQREGRTRDSQNQDALPAEERRALIRNGPSVQGVANIQQHGNLQLEKVRFDEKTSKFDPAALHLFHVSPIHRVSPILGTIGWCGRATRGKFVPRGG
jgi:hypothetical protein